MNKDILESEKEIISTAIFRDDLDYRFLKLIERFNTSSKFLESFPLRIEESPHFEQWKFENSLRKNI